MGHRASYIVVREGSAQAFNDQWGAMSIAEVFARGPEQCLRWLEDREPEDELLEDVWAEGGFLIDLDRRVALVFATEASGYVGWEDGLADLPEAEREQAQQDDAALRTDPETWIERMKARWSGFELQWVDGVQSLAAYLRSHDLELKPIKADEDWGPLGQIILGFVTDEQRREQLGAAEKPPEPTKTTLGSMAVVLPVVLVALIVRLLTAPIRWIVRPANRAEDAAYERRSDLMEKLREQTARLSVQTDDVFCRFERGLTLLELGAAGHAELDFDHCVRAVEDTEHDKVTLPAALHNRGIARAKLGLDKLSAADRERAESLGFHAPAVSWFRSWTYATWAMFRFVSGWS